MNWKRGEKISEPGVYPAIPLADYHGDVAEGFSVSHSGLELIFGGSLAHFYDQSWLNPDRKEREATEGMILGHAAHHLFLGERNFLQLFIQRPLKAPDGRDWNGNNLSCKAWLQNAASRGLTVIKSEQWETLLRMRKQLETNPMVKAGLLDGRVEHSFVWQDEETGIWCKSRPDVDPAGTGDFVDLKIVADISDEGLKRSIHTFGYHRQGAMVCEGASKTEGYPLTFRNQGEGEGMSFSLVFVESTRPHCVRVVTLEPEDLENGLYENRLALNLLAKGLKENYWPGPSGDQQDAAFLGIGYPKGPNGFTSWAAGANMKRAEQIKAQLAIAA